MTGKVLESRPLDGSETIVVFMQKYFRSARFARVLKLRSTQGSPLSLELFTKALLHVQKKHPLLNATLRGEKDDVVLGTKYFFDHHEAYLIPIETARPGRSAEDYAYDYVNAPAFDPAGHPLFSLVWCPSASDPNTSEVVLQASHAIVEGGCLNLLCEDILGSFAALLSGQPLPALTQPEHHQLPLPISQGNLLPESWKSPDNEAYKAAVSRFVERRKALATQPFQFLHEAPVVQPAAERKTGFLGHFWLDEPHMEKIEALAKKNNVSQKAVFCAASTLALGVTIAQQNNKTEEVAVRILAPFCQRDCITRLHKEVDLDTKFQLANDSVQFFSGHQPADQKVLPSASLSDELLRLLPLAQKDLDTITADHDMTLAISPLVVPLGQQKYAELVANIANPITPGCTAIVCENNDTYLPTSYSSVLELEDMRLRGSLNGAEVGGVVISINHFKTATGGVRCNVEGGMLETLVSKEATLSLFSNLETVLKQTVQSLL